MVILTRTDQLKIGHFFKKGITPQSKQIEVSNPIYIDCQKNSRIKLVNFTLFREKNY